MVVTIESDICCITRERRDPGAEVDEEPVHDPGQAYVDGAGGYAWGQLVIRHSPPPAFAVAVHLGLGWHRGGPIPAAPRAGCAAAVVSGHGRPLQGHVTGSARRGQRIVARLRAAVAVSFAVAARLLPRQRPSKGHRPRGGDPPGR
jgi:hypothetical protein